MCLRNKLSVLTSCGVEHAGKCQTLTYMCKRIVSYLEALHRSALEPWRDTLSHF
jgi:hypothetical protein